MDTTAAGPELIFRYFPELSSTQQEQISRLGSLYREWNDKINVVSRKDIDHLYMHHVLHSLALPKVVSPFKSGTQILDLGTGGGFPGIPLAICYPEVQFTLSDSILKKTTVARDIAAQLGLQNVTVIHARGEAVGKKFDFVTARGVTELRQLLIWARSAIRSKNINSVPNGLFAWKGLLPAQDEIKALGKGEYSEMYPIARYFAEPYFEEKVLLYVQA